MIGSLGVHNICRVPIRGCMARDEASPSLSLVMQATSLSASGSITCAVSTSHHRPWLTNRRQESMVGTETAIRITATIILGPRKLAGIGMDEQSPHGFAAGE